MCGTFQKLILRKTTSPSTKLSPGILKDKKKKGKQYSEIAINKFQENGGNKF